MAEFGSRISNAQATSGSERISEQHRGAGPSDRQGRNPNDAQDCQSINVRPLGVRVCMEAPLHRARAVSQDDAPPLPQSATTLVTSRFTIVRVSDQSMLRVMHGNTIIPCTAAISMSLASCTSIGGRASV